MARKAIKETPKNAEVAKQVQLSKLVISFGEKKTQLDALDKEVKKDNAEIKTLMKELGQSKYESGGYTVSYTEQKRESMNEDALLELLSKKHKLYTDLGIIKTKEYIDSDALESAIYNGDIPKAELLKMDKCRETKIIPTLKLTKKGD